MLQIERDFLHSIKTKNHEFTKYCLNAGLTANTCDEDGVNALEYALWYKNDEALFELANHPKTSQKTLGRTLDLLEALRLSDKDLLAFREYEEKTSFLSKLIDTLFSNKGARTCLNAAGTMRRYCLIQRVLYDKYQNQRN